MIQMIQWKNYKICIGLIKRVERERMSEKKLGVARICTKNYKMAGRYMSIERPKGYATW